ncbi:lysylphosphatidylglycerol synthase domain-containing protein [Marmoricola sp. RAF53]|uniref:lysylphosphatidylglycerol synthase domain-containing protein n=1 Tax=Marmoricola sp. RAF53 TaxID=3233059 RepID=UPI003F9B854F
MAGAGRTVRPGILLTAESGRRNRRTLDAVLGVATTVLAGTAALVARGAGEQDRAVADAVVTVLGWAPAVWHLVLLGTAAGCLAIVVAALVQRRWLLLRDVGVALGLLLGLGAVLSRVVADDWWTAGTPWGRWGFPDQRLGVVVALAVVAGAELVTGVRRALGWAVVASAAGLVALGAALPSEVLGALALGLAAGTTTRVLLGSAAGFPPSADVRASVEALGVPLAEVHPLRRQEPGASAYEGTQPDGRVVHVRVLGRDSQDAQRLARRWRLLAYRDPPRSAPVGRLEQVEHEALATLLAAQAGVRVPEVVIAALGQGGHAGIVTRRPGTGTLDEADCPSDEVLVEVWRQVRRLHDAGIAHGRLHLGHVVVAHGYPELVGFHAATLGAPATSKAVDAAELLVSSTVRVGADRALAAAVRGAGPELVVAALPYLQRGALSPATRDAARHSEVELDELRSAAAKATGSDAVEIAPLRRVRVRDLLVTAAVGFSVYLLISQLADIGFATIWRNLRTADPVWLLVALLLAQVGFLPEAASLRGAVRTPLPLQACVALKSAMKFINLSVPGSAGSVAATVRFVQRQGGTSAEAVASGAIDDLAEKLVQLALVLLLLPLADVRPDTGGFHLGAPDSRLVVAILAAVVVSVVLVVAVPAIREKVLPQLRSGIEALRVLRDRSKRLQLFGGNLLGEVVFALALGAVCLGYGVSLTLPQLVLVNVGASVLASLIPVPGGVGAAEATLSAGLIACGVDDSTAFAIAITHRLCTNYLPPLWGYFSLRWLRAGGFL